MYYQLSCRAYRVSVSTMLGQVERSGGGGGGVLGEGGGEGV